MPPAVGLLMLKRRQSGVNPIRPIKETRADLIRLVLTWLWLTVPDFKKGGRGGGEADEWTSLLPPSFVPPSLHSRMALTQLIRGTWDVIRRTAELPEEFVQIANFANDKPGISMGFLQPFSDARQVRRRKKVRHVKFAQIHTFSPRGRSRVNMLTSQPSNACWRLSASLSVLRLQQRSKMGLSGDVERYHR